MKGKIFKASCRLKTGAVFELRVLSISQAFFLTEVRCLRRGIREDLLPLKIVHPDALHRQLQIELFTIHVSGGEAGPAPACGAISNDFDYFLPDYTGKQYPKFYVQEEIVAAKASSAARAEQTTIVRHALKVLP